MTQETASVTNDCISSLYKWFIANRLSINFDKTCYIVFPPNKNDNINLVIQNIVIKRVDHFKYLRVVIDSNLKWTAHIECVYQKLIKYVSIFYKLRSKLPSQVLKNIYHAFVNSHIGLLYGIEMYGNTVYVYLDRLDKLNNKLLRILQYRPLSNSLCDLYTMYKSLPIPISFTYINYVFWFINGIRMQVYST